MKDEGFGNVSCAGKDGLNRRRTSSDGVPFFVQGMKRSGRIGNRWDRGNGAGYAGKRGGMDRGRSTGLLDGPVFLMTITMRDQAYFPEKGNDGHCERIPMSVSGK